MQAASNLTIVQDRTDDLPSDVTALLNNPKWLYGPVDVPSLSRFWDMANSEEVRCTELSSLSFTHESPLYPVVTTRRTSAVLQAILKVGDELELDEVLTDFR